MFTKTQDDLCIEYMTKERDQALARSVSKVITVIIRARHILIISPHNLNDSYHVLMLLQLSLGLEWAASTRITI
jgi:hypothetical protein